MKALSDTSRLRLLNSLMGKPQYVEELSERMGLSASTVSFHLKKLEEAGLAAKSRDQYYAVYAADERLLDKTLRELVGFGNADADGQDARMRSYREKVVKSFFRDGRLVRLPAQYKKQQIVLEEISRRFEPGRRYPERELNLIIMGVHEDYCTIRRLMIGEGLMEREENVYWRTRAAAGGEADERTAPAAAAERAKESERQQTGRSGGMKTRSEIKREYKETVREMGIVSIKCLQNGRMWLGAAHNPESTLKRHRFELSLGTSWHKDLQKDWNEYGEKEFSFEIVDTVKPDPEKDKAEELAELEALWREKLAAELLNEYK